MRTGHNRPTARSTVLNYPPPQYISKTEESLSRKARVTLAQLRSGYSSHLNTFLNRINHTIQTGAAQPVARPPTPPNTSSNVPPTPRTCSALDRSGRSCCAPWIGGPGGYRLNHSKAKPISKLTFHSQKLNLQNHSSRAKHKIFT